MRGADLVLSIAFLALLSAFTCDGVFLGVVLLGVLAGVAGALSDPALFARWGRPGNPDPDDTIIKKYH